MLHNAIERILQAQGFWADPLGKLFVTIFAALYRPVPALKDFLNGVWFGHPLHPAITDVPIGAYVVALVFYLISFLMRLGAVPSPVEVWLSFVGFLIVIGSAYVGGELVYNLGTQVDRHAWRGGGTKWTALDVTDIPRDRPTKAKAGAQTLVVVRRDTGMDALHDVCAHQGCSLSEGKLVGDAIECQCHGSRYRLHDGLVVRGPAVFDQPHYEVRETDGKIEVHRTDTR